MISEIHTSTYCKSSNTARACNAAETGRVDRHVDRGWRIENRMVQHADRIHPKFEFPGLRNLHTLDEVGVEIEARRSFNPFQAKGTVLSGRGIDQQKIAVGVRNRLVGEIAVQ